MNEATDPVLQGVDLALERLLLFGLLSTDVESCLDALRSELLGMFPPLGFGGR